MLDTELSKSARRAGGGLAMGTATGMMEGVHVAYRRSFGFTRVWTDAWSLGRRGPFFKSSRKGEKRYTRGKIPPPSSKEKSSRKFALRY